jgi:hypothetical protein
MIKTDWNKLYCVVVRAVMFNWTGRSTYCIESCLLLRAQCILLCWCDVFGDTLNVCVLVCEVTGEQCLGGTGVGGRIILKRVIKNKLWGISLSLGRKTAGWTDWLQQRWIFSWEALTWFWRLTNKMHWFNFLTMAPTCFGKTMTSSRSDCVPF